MAETDQISAEDKVLNLRQIIDSSPALLHTARTDGYLDFFNQTWLDFAGLPLEQLLGWGWVSVIHPEDVKGLLRDMRASFARKEPFQQTSRVRRADGVYRWMVHKKVPVFDRAGNVIRWNGSSFDIDERKKVEERLEESVRENEALNQRLRRHEAFLAEAQRLSQTGSFGWKPSSGELVFSDETYRIYEFDPTAQVTLNMIMERIHPDDRDMVRETAQQTATSGDAIDFTHRLLFEDGRVKYLHILARRLPNTGNDIEFSGATIDVTAGKRAEEMLRKSERELRGIIETIPAMLWSTSPAGQPTNLSRRFLEYCGLTFEEFAKSKPERCIHPDDLKEAGRAFVDAMSSGGSYSAVHRMRRTDGEYRWHHAMAEPLRDRDGTIIQWYGITIDVDEAKRAEEIVRKSEKELRTLINIMPAYVATALPDGSVDFMTQSWLDYSGQTKEEAMGWGWAAAIHPDDIDGPLAQVRAGFLSGEPVDVELRCRRVDGIYHWFLNRSIALRDDDGKVLKWFGILFDINALKEAENALRAREHELLCIIDTIPSMLWSTWPNGEPRHLSQRLLEYFGVGFSELADRGWLRFIHPDDRAEAGKSFYRAMETGASYNITNRLRNAQGEYRWHQTRGEPLRDSDGQILQWYGLSIDIDEGKRAEDNLLDTRLKLAKASRLATVAELAGSIAHELNQPLMSILANAQAANRWLNVAPQKLVEANSSIERIVRDARAADETMQHIRALFKQESFYKENVSVPDIIRESIRIVQEDPKKRLVTIECHFDDYQSPIQVDKIQIQQVFINLFANAIEALEGRDAPLIVLRAATDSDRALIQVMDNGPGVIDPDRIFDAFMTTKANGMGIGLAVSRTIIEAHGGRLWAENNDRGGATFNVALPLIHPGIAEH